MLYGRFQRKFYPLGTMETDRNGNLRTKEVIVGHKTEYSPRVLMGSNGKPEGEETFACKTCGACVAETDLQRHTNWHALFGAPKGIYVSTQA